ncbi:hypothetical protein HQ487_04950 [Candidatus Uhrbacteria bacterium]|nr:hypothetical protein [Candidatus Uhrbacteria bacterium]
MNDKQKRKARKTAVLLIGMFVFAGIMGELGNVLARANNLKNRILRRPPTEPPSET